MGTQLNRTASKISLQKFAIVGLVLLAVLATACGAAGTASTSSGSGLVAIGAGLQGPDGFSASSYTEGLANVSALAFDSDGRMWAATAAYEDDGTDAVYVIAAAGDEPIKVLTAQHTPMGLLWHDGWLYVSSTDGVDAYRTFDGTTFLEHRTVVTLPDGVGLVGGIAVDSTSRFSIGVSAPCDACTPESEYSAAIVSFLADGSDLRVDVEGVRAPVGLVYFPGTDDLFITMNQRDDLGDDTPGDWLAVVEAGQDWGFPDCYGQRGSACTGAGDPVAELDAHAAASGVAIVTGELGSAAGTSALVAEWTRGKVMRVALLHTASGYTSEVTTFLTGFKSPVPVVLGPDGALYVGDWATGTVYRIAQSGS